MESEKVEARQKPAPISPGTYRRRSQYVPAQYGGLKEAFSNNVPHLEGLIPDVKSYIERQTRENEINNLERDENIDSLRDAVRKYEEALNELREIEEKEIKRMEDDIKIKRDVDSRKYSKWITVKMVRTMAEALYLELQNEVDSAILGKIPLPFGYKYPIYAGKSEKGKYPDFDSDVKIVNKIRKTIKDFFKDTMGITDSYIDDFLL